MYYIYEPKAWYNEIFAWACLILLRTVVHVSNVTIDLLLSYYSEPLNQSNQFLQNTCEKREFNFSQIMGHIRQQVLVEIFAIYMLWKYMGVFKKKILKITITVPMPAKLCTHSFVWLIQVNEGHTEIMITDHYATDD